jgi:hypothetical protein
MTDISHLFGDPSDVQLQHLNMTAQNLSFSSTVDSVLPVIGQYGCPDPAKDPMAAYRYLDGMRDIIRQAAGQKPLIRLADKDLNVVAEITGEVSASVEELMADTGQAVVVVQYDHWIEDYVINGTSITEDLHLLIDPIPTQQDWRVRWGGKIHEISLVNNEDGTSTITFLALSHREHMKKLLFASTPWFPPEIQPLRMWILPGPLRSVFFITGMINLARLFFPGLNIITNLFNPGAWLGYVNPQNWLNFNPLSWPIQIAFVNPITDTSMWTVLAATWTDWHSTMADLMSNAGCMVRAYTWLTTDKDSPHTALSDLLETGNADELSQITGIPVDKLYKHADAGSLGNLARPTRNCVILDCQDKSGHVGPTGTALDGLLSLIGITLDDMITDVLYDQQSRQVLDGQLVIDTTQINREFSKLLGINIPPPHVIWREGQFTGMVHREVNLHKAAPMTMMIGGRSPTIVNQLQTFGIRYAISQLSMVPTLNVNMGVFSGPANMSPQIPLTSGLENLYQGQLDNILLAWERYTSPVRAIHAGSAAYQEYIERGSSSAYTLAAWLGLAEANWKTRPYYGFQSKALNGRPWVYGIDFTLGDRVGFEMDGIIFVDQMAAVKWQYDRTSPSFLVISVGDDREKHDPIAAGMRALQGVYALIGAFLGEGTIFG